MEVPFAGRRWCRSRKPVLKELGCTEVGELLTPEQQNKTPAGCENQGYLTDMLIFPALANRESSWHDSCNRLSSSEAVPTILIEQAKEPSKALLPNGRMSTSLNFIFFPFFLKMWLIWPYQSHYGIALALHWHCLGESWLAGVKPRARTRES